MFELRSSFDFFALLLSVPLCIFKKILPFFLVTFHARQLYVISAMNDARDTK